MAGKKKARTGDRFVVRIPSSTSNLGAGFDCFGLALKLYLTIEARVQMDAKVPCQINTSGGAENAAFPRTSANLIYRAMSFAASREDVSLPPVVLDVQNEIPLASGLGSSAAAIVGGITLMRLICNQKMPAQKVVDYATEFEGHPDNVSAALFGGFVVNTTRDKKVVSLKSQWPGAIKILVVSPHSQLDTSVAREALPRLVTRADAINNLQRTALFTTALSRRRYDLLREAMRDRLHQPQRKALVPGLAEALAIGDMPGLLGIALSGAGPSILALVTEHSEALETALVNCFRKHGVRSTIIRRLEVDNEGCQVL
ncbi:MAG: homoserine kinase [Pyrinomonadaceae bacterium]